MPEFVALGLILFFVTALVIGVFLYFYLKTTKGKKVLSFLKMANIVRLVLIISFIVATILTFLIKLTANQSL
jgi:heme/copper-type cytochrome/quinol oxidase subunit 1